MLVIIDVIVVVGLHTLDVADSFYRMSALSHISDRDTMYTDIHAAFGGIFHNFSGISGILGCFLG